MALKIFILTFVVCGVFCDYHNPDGGEPQGPAEYSFKYAVDDAESGNNFGQDETRAGDAIKGSYVIRLPDSRTQKVFYSVNGDSGYVAEVIYEGEAQFPDEPPKNNYH